VERHVALHLLHDLVDVAVEDGHRAEPLEISERLRSVLGDPAPLRIDRPQRNVREDHDRGAARERRQVPLEPLELIRAQAAELARLEVEHVDEPHEVHPAVVERLPAATRPAHREPVQVLGAAVREHVVLSRDVEGPLDAGALERLAHRVERARLLGVGDVAGVDQEGRLGVERLDARDRGLEGAQRVGIRRALEPDVGVADLDEAEALPGPFRLGRPRPEHARARHTPDHRPQQAGAGPRHALQEAAPIELVPFIRVAHEPLLSGMTTTLPVIRGCSVQKYS
jgi:hypothetical protein